MPEISDTKDALAAIDIFVMPSLKEGLGLALMEAMAMGLAVIGSDIGGIKSLIRDKENGLLFKVGDIGSLAKAIIMLLSDPAERMRLGANAQMFIKQNFSQNKMVEETQKEYLECLSVKG